MVMQFVGAGIHAHFLIIVEGAGKTIGRRHDLLVKVDHASHATRIATHQTLDIETSEEGMVGLLSSGET